MELADHSGIGMNSPPALAICIWSSTDWPYIVLFRTLFLLTLSAALMLVLFTFGSLALTKSCFRLLPRRLNTDFGTFGKRVLKLLYFPDWTSIGFLNNTLNLHTFLTGRWTLFSWYSYRSVRGSLTLLIILLYIGTWLPLRLLLTWLLSTPPPT